MAQMMQGMGGGMGGGAGGMPGGMGGMPGGMGGMGGADGPFSADALAKIKTSPKIAKHLEDP